MIFYADIFISFTNSSFSAREDDNVIFLVISKSGVTQDDIDVIVSLSDATALGKVIPNSIDLRI